MNFNFQVPILTDWPSYICNFQVKLKKNIILSFAKVFFHKAIDQEVSDSGN